MASMRIGIWELRMMLQQAIMDMLSLSFRPRVIIKRIKKAEGDGLIVEGDYFLFGESGSFKAALGKDREIVDLELIPEQ